MKKVIIIVGGVIAVLLVVAVLVPVIFKDDIKKAVDQAVAENVRAKVFYDPDGLNLTLFKNFPNFTLGMEQFGISGIDQFEGDTLVSVGSFEVVIDLMSVVSGDQIMINAITLDEPNIMVMVLPDGSANYDIAVESGEETTTAETETAPSGETKFSIGIKKWEIINGNVVYLDQSMDFFTSIIGINHQGSGDFTQDLFDLITNTTVDGISMGFEGVEYMSDKSLSVDITLSMDLPNGKYTFKENRISLNDFGFGFDGYVAMPGDDIDMDISFSGQHITLRSILSLIPGAYSEYLAGVEAGGDINFGGSVKGTYNETIMPTIDASLNVSNGSIKYAEYPIPMEQIEISTKMSVPGEDINKMRLDVDNFSLLLDGEKVASSLSFSNLDNYNWAFALDGNLDLEKLMKVIPLEGMELRGKVSADFKTSGNMALVEAEKYEDIPAEGNVAVTDFYFSSEDLPQGFGINSTKASFNPKSIVLNSFDATLGKSDMQMDGYLQNYIGFAMSDEQVLKGQLNFNSNSFDLNEWMVAEDTVVTESGEDSVALEVVRIPENIDFVLAATMSEILYDSMKIENLKGDIVVREGAARLQEVDFDLLGGKFTMDGSYVTADVEDPTFDFKLGIDQLSIPSSFQAFNTVQTLAPAAENMTGSFSTDFNIAGALGQDMMPKYEEMVGAGIIEIANASMSGTKLTSAIASVTKLTGGGQTEGVSLNDVLMQAEIKDGRMHVKPFDVVVNNYKTTIAGSNGIDGSMDYRMKMNVPAGVVGSALNSALASLTGGKPAVGSTINLNLKVTGTYDDPKVGLAGSEPGDDGESGGVGASASAAAKAKLDEEKEKAEAAAKEAIEKQKKEAEEKAKAEAEKLKEEAEKKLLEEAEKLKLKEEAEKAKDALKGLFKKKKGGGK